MIEHSETCICVTERLDAPVGQVWAVLVEPRRHAEIDGSGMVRSVAGEQALSRITGVDQVFTMQMRYPSLGDYRTDNRVIEFDEERAICWTTAREGQESPGVRWRWQLQPDGPGSTVVRHSYDWSRVHDPAVLARVSFPRVQPEQMLETVHSLAVAATGLR
jgi:hypothetical protein